MESVGAYPPRQLLKEAIAVLVGKANALAVALDTALASEGGGVMSAVEASKATLAAMTVQPDLLV